MLQMCVFVEIGEIRNEDSSSEKAQNLVKKLQNFIANNYYNCSNEILLCLGKIYAVGGEFTDNIDLGAGTANFTNKSIQIYCGKEHMNNID